MRFPRPAPWSWPLLSTGVVVIAFIVAALVAWHRSMTIDELAQDIAGNADPSIRHLADARTELHTMDALVISGLFESTGRGAGVSHEAFEQSKRRLHQDIQAYLQLPFFPTERDRWKTAAGDVAEAESELDAVVAKLDSGDRAGAIELRDAGLAETLQRADAAVGDQIAFDAEQASQLGEEIERARHAAQQTSYALHALAVALTLVVVGVSVGASRRYVSALRAAGEAEAKMTKRLEAVAAAAVSIAENVRRSDLRDVLQSIVETARAVAAADFAALGIGTDPSRPFEPFVHSGVDPSQAEGHEAPRPVGVLGAVIVHGSTLRSPDVTRDARFNGLPEKHPAVGPFLGTPVRHDRENVGHLYLARGPGASAFSEQDERAVELLATIAATAIQNAKLYAELREEVARREDLMSIVSHDLRNPLSAVGMAARTLQRAMGADVPGQRQTQVIVRNVARMDRLIGDLLALARLQEGGTLAIEPRAQDAAALVQDVIDGFATAAADKGIELRSRFADSLPPVYCDGGRIGQVLSNLIGNALKFTPRGGAIIVRVTRGDAEDVCFSVRDTGVGIPEDALSHVFERFWQNERHRAHGTGLGLYIAKGIVDAHHGRIWVTSRVGEGSDFQFTVPAASWPDENRLQLPRPKFAIS